MNRRVSFFMILLLLTPMLAFSILGSAALVLSSTISSSGMVNYDPVPAGGWLHTDGIWVKDSAGRIVAMRSIANFPWNFVSTQFIQNAKSHGISVVNLGFRPPSTAGSLPEFSFDYNTQISQMDAIVNLCKQNNVYVAPAYLDSTAELASFGISGVDNVINHLVSVWTPIVSHYENESTVVGIRLIDEPNLSAADELKMWTQTIGNLRQINPNLLWFTHTITEVRFGTQYFNTLPWKTAAEVPYPNIIMDGGIWMSPNHPTFGYNYGSDDYAGADALFNDVTTRMANFRDKVQIPTGITPGIDEYYTVNNARTYFLNKTQHWMEQNWYFLTLYVAKYQIEADNGLAALSKVFPDTPYPYYW